MELAKDVDYKTKVLVRGRGGVNEQRDAKVMQ